MISRLVSSADANNEIGLPGLTKHELTGSERRDLLHAALLHDCGHLPFSHASEVAFMDQSDLTVGGIPLRKFQTPAIFAGLPNRLAELLSIAVILSPRFKRFYRDYVRAAEQDEEVGDAIYRVASLILGTPPSPDKPGFAYLISGKALDADKLDYVSRDSLACGIPIGIDTGRLFLRSSFVSVAKDTLKKLYRRFGHESISDQVSTDQIHFIVNASGRDTIEEVIGAKASLYHRVYFHQTTRNAERLFEKCIASVVASTKVQRGFLSDVLDAWPLSDLELLKRLTEVPDVEGKNLALRLARRQLPKRALVFGVDDSELFFPLLHVFGLSSNHPAERDLRRTSLSKLSKNNLSANLLGELEEEIAQETLKLFALVQSDMSKTWGENIPNSSEYPMVLISPIQHSPATHDICLVLQNGELTLASEFHNSTQTVQAADIFKGAGYVLTDPSWRELVFVAARKVLAEKFAEIVNTRFDLSLEISNGPINGPPDSARRNDHIDLRGMSGIFVSIEKAIRRTGLSAPRFNDVMTSASRHGYFDNNPLLLPVEERGVVHIAKKFSHFRGQHGWRTSVELIEVFVQQFPPRFRREVIELLAQMDALTTKVVAEKTRAALEKFAEGSSIERPIYVVPLSPNSGQEVRIALEQEFHSDVNFKKRFTLVHSIHEFFGLQDRDDSAKLAFVDDNIVSGTQAFSQFASWLALPKEKLPIEIAEESNIEQAKLGEKEREKLIEAIRNGLVGICVAVGAEARSKKNLKKMGKMIDAAYPKPKDLLSDEGGEKLLRVICGSSLEKMSFPVSQGLKTFLSEVGFQVLASAKYSKRSEELSKDEESFCRGNSFGYGNIGGLTITTRNVPSSSVTALWCPGIYKLRPWFPLAIRRGYVSKLVLG